MSEPPKKAMANHMEVSIAEDCANPECEEQGKQRCSQCKSIWYCSEPCQKKDWRFHKLLCGLAAASKPRPSPYFRRVIFIKAGKKPVFTWLPVKLASGPGQSAPEPESPLGSSDLNASWVAIHHDSSITLMDGREIRHGDRLEGESAVNGVLVCAEANVDELPLNTCANRLLGDRLTRPLRGSLTFVAKVKLQGEHFVVDIGTRHFSRALFRHAESTGKKETDGADGKDGGE